MVLIAVFVAVTLWATMVTQWRLRRYHERAVVRRTWKSALLVMARITLDECVCQGNLRHPCPACLAYESARRVMRYHMGKRD